MRKIYLPGTLVLLCILCCITSFTQDFSNKGKDFWVGYGYHEQMSGNSQEMVLYFAADQNSNVTVTIPGLGYSQSYFVAANTVLTSAPIPKSGFQDARLRTESTAGENKGIHITSDKPIVAYAHIYNASVSGASILFPTNTLGKDYYSVNYKNISNTSNANCWFYVVATDPGVTTVEINPAAATLNHTAGVPFTVTLTQGQIYNVMGQTTGTTGVDLTGSTIKSINTGNGCKKIAVFSGSGRISITCNGTSSSSDNYMVQAFPKSAWGKKYLTVSSGGNQPNNIYRVCVQDPTTVVTVNGAPIGLPLQGNFYYEIAASTTPKRIEADKPIMVAQYFTSQGACGNGLQPGDPEVLYLSSVEQNINKVLWNATPNSAITQHYFNVIVPNTGTAITSFKLDGATIPPASFTVHPMDPGYSYMVKSVSAGQHLIQSDSGFNAIAYGFGGAESYGYNAGTNIKDIYQQIGVSTEFGIETSPSVCIGSPFKFKISLPYQALSLDWDLTSIGQGHIIQTGAPYVIKDSSTFVNGKEIWWYSIPTTTVNTVGTYPISITAENSGVDNCGNTQEIEFTLEVSANPVADFSYVPIQCAAEPVQFNDASTTAKPTYKYFWDFGDPSSGANNISILKNPAHTFLLPGTYHIKYYNITTPGCISNLVEKDITVPPAPTATISSNASACINGASVPVTFTATGGVAPYTFTYTLDNGSGPVAQPTINTSTGNSVTILVPTSIAGTFTYNLINVKNQNSTLCTQAVTGQTATVTVSANTTINLTSAASTSSQTVCVNAAITNITYAIGGNGSATVSGLPAGINYIFNAGVVTISGTPTVINTTPQTFTYSVNAVGSCLPSSVTGTITVNPDATIVLSSAPATANQEVCKNVAIANIVYTVSGGGTGAIATGLPTGVNLNVSSGTVTISGIPTQAGIFNYTINTTGSCFQAQITGMITVNELPSANFTIAPPGCVNKAVTFNDASTPNSGSINNWQWTFGDATTGTGATTIHTYTLAGSYTVGLIVTTDKGCSNASAVTQTLNIAVNPVADFTIPEVCLNDIAAFFPDASQINPGTITSWKWDFGDGSPVTTTKDGTHKYLNTGSFPVTHTVFSSTGCSDAKTQNIVINGANPVADFSVVNPTTLCSNQLVSINDLSSVNPGVVTKLEIYWDNAGAPAVFDLDDVPANKTYTHQYPVLTTTKSYAIRLRAFSGTLCVNDKITTVTVNATPKVQFLNMPDVCLDAAPFQITQASETGGVAGTPTFSGPGVSSTGLFSPAVAGFGTHTINYKYTSTAGGCVDQLSKTIHVLEPVAASFTSSAACETKDVTFTDNTTPTEGTLTKWTWDFGDGSPLVIKNSSAAFTHKFPGAGPFNVKLVVTTSNGCQSIPKITTVNVSPQPKVNFNIPATVCLPNASVTFNNLSSIADGTEAGFSYLWNFGDAGSPTNSSAIKDGAHTYTAVGPFNVNLQITSAAGCIHDTTIILNTIHPQPIAAFTTDKIDVCIGGSFDFTDKSNGLDGGITQWNWVMDDGNVKNVPNFSYTYTAVKVYNVGLFIYNSQGCRSNTATVALGVNPYPVANAGPDKLVLEGGQVALTPAMSIGVNVNYLWSPSTGLNNPTSPSPLASPPTDMTYTLVLTSDKGCVSNADNVFVKVLKAPAIPNIFSPNGDGVHDRWDINYLNTYPGASIDIYNRYGQLVFHSIGYGTSWDGKSNGKDVPVGTYYYVIDPKNGRPKYAGYVDVIR